MSLLLCLLIQVDIFQPAPMVQAGTDSIYVVMFTASWCGPCQTYKSSGQLSDLQSQIAVTVSDVDRGGRRWHNGAIPCFWICDKATRKPLRKFAPGGVRPSVLITAARELAK